MPPINERRRHRNIPIDATWSRLWTRRISSTLSVAGSRLQLYLLGHGAFPMTSLASVESHTQELIYYLASMPDDVTSSSYV